MTTTVPAYLKMLSTSSRAMEARIKGLESGTTALDAAVSIKQQGYVFGTNRSFSFVGQVSSIVEAAIDGAELLVKSIHGANTVNPLVTVFTPAGHPVPATGDHVQVQSVGQSNGQFVNITASTYVVPVEIKETWGGLTDQTSADSLTYYDLYKVDLFPNGFPMQRTGGATQAEDDDCRRRSKRQTNQNTLEGAGQAYALQPQIATGQVIPAGTRLIAIRAGDFLHLQVPVWLA